MKKEKFQKIDFKNLNIYQLCSGVILSKASNNIHTCPHIIKKEIGNKILLTTESSSKVIEYFEDIYGNGLVCCKNCSPKKSIKFWYKDEDEE